MCILKALNILERILGVVLIAVLLVLAVKIVIFLVEVFQVAIGVWFS